MSEYHDRMYNYDSEVICRQIEESILFSLNKEEESNAYAREKLKMIDNLAKYLFAIDEFENINFGVEIMELADRCIKFFDPTAGTPFLAYFLSSWKTEYKRLKGREAKEESLQGLHVNKKLMDKILKNVRYAKSVGIDYKSNDFIQLVSDETDRPINEIAEYIALISQGVTPNEIEDDEGNIIDIISAISSLGNIDDGIEEQSVIEKWGMLIETTFNSLQERQKSIVSELITLKIADSEYVSEEILTGFMNRAFFSKEIYSQIKFEEKITARTIAEQHGVSEQSASRTLNTFIKSIKSNIQL